MTGFQKMCLRETNQTRVRDLSIRDPEKDHPIAVALDERFPEKCVNIGNDFSPKIRHELLSFLKLNIQTFVWSAADMPGIDINFPRFKRQPDIQTNEAKTETVRTRAS